MLAALIEDFKNADLAQERPFEEHDFDLLRRHLSSNWEHGVLVYEPNGEVRAIWSISQVSPYFVDIATPDCRERGRARQFNSAYMALKIAYDEAVLHDERLV